MSTNNFYSRADHPRYTPLHSSDTPSISQVALSVLAGACVLYFLWDHYPQVRILTRILIKMVGGLLVDLVPERLVFALASSSNPYSEGSDLATDQKQPENMQAAKIEVLRKAFRLDSLGLFKSTQSEGPLRGISMLMKSAPSDAPPGLGNWDNSCYQNSVIQGLAALPSLKTYLVSATSEFPRLSENTTNGALFDTISQLHDQENFGQRLWTPAKLKSMSSFQQQDAQEYYSKILDELDKEISKAVKGTRAFRFRGLSDAQDFFPEATPISTRTEGESGQDSSTDNDSSISCHMELLNPLDGLLAQRVGCIRCGYTEGLSMIPFNCITVPLGRDWIYDVRDCLSEYTKLELIEGVDCAKCSLLRTQKTLSSLVETSKDRMVDAIRQNIESRLGAVNEALEEDDFADNTLIKKCQVPKKSWVSSTKSRQAVVARPPKALVIHVNRSVFDELTGAQMKNYADVRFPKDLDLGSWCLGSRSEGEEEWSENPTMSMITDLDDGFDCSPFQYTLRAVVTHYGRHENGHYICYRQHPTASNVSRETLCSQEDAPKVEKEASKNDQAWWRLSDEDVSKVSEKDVLGQGGVFMLFYERCEIDSTPSSTRRIESAVDAPLMPLHTPSSLEGDASATDKPSNLILGDDAPVPMPNDFGQGEFLLGDEGPEGLLPDNGDLERLHLPLQSPAALPADLTADNVLDSKSNASLPSTSGEAPLEVQQSPMGHDAGLKAYPTPPPEDIASDLVESSSSRDGDTSATDTEDSPSTHMTSDDDVESEADCVPANMPPNQSWTSQSPALMRTAGSAGNRRNNDSRSSLPMVAAT